MINEVDKYCGKYEILTRHAMSLLRVLLRLSVVMMCLNAGFFFLVSKVNVISYFIR